MIYTKYESSGTCSFRQEDFENRILKTYFLTPWPTYPTNQNHLNNFGRGPPRDHSCEVWSKSNEWFQRRRCLSKNVFARRTTHDARRTTTDDGQSPVKIAHHDHLVLRWAKKEHVWCWLTEPRTSHSGGKRSTTEPWLPWRTHIQQGLLTLLTYGPVVVGQASGQGDVPRVLGLELSLLTLYPLTHGQQARQVVPGKEPLTHGKMLIYYLTISSLLGGQ